MLRALLRAQKSDRIRTKMRHRTIWANAALFAVLLGAVTGPLLGQFSGPSLGQDIPVNTPLVPTTDPAILYPPDRPLVLGQGDLIVIHLFGISDFSTPERVAVDGTLQVPLIGPVHVLGLTPADASTVIAEHLQSAGMYRAPQVSLQIIESPSQVATVTGEMHGIVPVLGHRGLFSVLAAAGQFPATASHTVLINRPGVRQPIVINLGPDPGRSSLANVPIFPQDTIVVPRTGVVYLLGSFKSQAAIPLQQNSPLTLLQATALGGGVAFEGRYSDLRIIRTVGYERKVVKVDIMKIMKGKEPDPVLQADDIVFIPTNQWKALLTNGGFQAASGIASLLIIAFQR